jgi:mono/diheme cytochrome c family protein
MAQSYQSGPDTDPANESDPKQPGFHYYSGGEVKELENTRVSPLLWGFWSVVILGAVLWLFIGGALGPTTGHPFKPSIGSVATVAAVQADLNTNAAMGNSAKQADMAQLVPFLGGDSLDTAITNGSNTYQSYCIGCHGPNQDGNGVNASALNPKPRNLHDGPFMRETLNYQRINTSLHYGVHGTAMPRWENTLSEHEIQEVISYVLSLTWTMPIKSTDTTTQQLGTPMPKSETPSTQKSVTGSTTGTAGGSFVHGGSVSNSPAPITPTVEGNPAAATSTAPPSQSGQSSAATPINPNTPAAPTTTAATAGGTMPSGTP